MSNKSTLKISTFATYAISAAILNTIVFFVAKSSGATMIVNQGGAQEIVLPLVIGATLISMFGAAFATNLIGKKYPSFISKSAWLGAIFGVVSAISPITVADEFKTSLALASNHIIAGVLWYVGINKASK
jgi:hypothetical protein